MDYISVVTSLAGAQKKFPASFRRRITASSPYLTAPAPTSDYRDEAVTQRGLVDATQRGLVDQVTVRTPRRADAWECDRRVGRDIRL